MRDRRRVTLEALGARAPPSTSRCRGSCPPSTHRRHCVDRAPARARTRSVPEEKTFYEGLSGMWQSYPLRGASARAAEECLRLGHNPIAHLVQCPGDERSRCLDVAATTEATGKRIDVDLTDASKRDLHL